MSGALGAPQSDKGAIKDDVAEHDDDGEDEVKERHAAAECECARKACVGVAQTGANGRRAVM